MDSALQLMQTDAPKCQISTDFPFEDLKRSVMNISCRSTFTLYNVSNNDSALYTCRAKLAFKSVKYEGDERNRRKIDEM